MKIKKIIAALTMCGAMILPTLHVDAEGSLPAKAFISGEIGSTSVWTAESATIGSTVASIDGDAQYQAEWKVADSGTTTLSYLALSIPNVTTDSYPDLSINVTEVWIDGQKIDYVMSPNAVQLACYEAGRDPEARVYLYDGLKGSNVADIAQNTTITQSIKVIFTVSGLGTYGTSNITENVLPTEEATTSENGVSPVDTTASETTSDTESGVDSSTTGDAGVAAAAVIGLTITAGAAILSKVRFKKKH